MKKNSSKKNEMNNSDLISEIEKRFERHTNILMEKMDSNVKTVTEQYGGLAGQISEVKNDVKEIKNDIAIIKPAVEAHSKDFKEIKSELYSVKMAVMETSHDTEDLKKRVKRVEEKALI